MRARAEAEDLLKQLHETPALLDLTANPLLLSMIAMVHRHGGGGKLPEKRVELYEDICKVFLGKRQEARRQELLLRHDQMQLVLEPLAYFMLNRGMRTIRPPDAQPAIADPLKRVGVEITAESFLKLVENVSGLLLEQESGVYWFAHKTFEEFLAAAYVTKNQLTQELTSKIEDIWWQETIRLCCAMSDATPIIAACLADGRSSLSALTLALDCLNDAREAQPEVRKHLISTLEQCLEDADIERRHLAANVVLTRRVREMAYLNEGTFVSTSYVTCAEYQLFLDEQDEAGNHRQADHWATSLFPPGQAQNPVLGMRASDAEEFCTWLTRREGGLWQYRLPHPDELSERTLSHFARGTGFWLTKNRVHGDKNKRFTWIGEPVLLSPESIEGMLAQDFIGARALVRARSIDLDLDLDLDLARTHARTRDFALDIARADFLYTALLPIKATETQSQATSFLARNVARWSIGKGKRWQDTKIESAIDNCFEIYFALLILNQRIEGHLPACEGIVVVKERTS